MQTSDPQKNLASALGRLPSGVFILTLARDGVETGMLASWVQQCAFKPPMVSFVIQRGRAIADLLPVVLRRLLVSGRSSMNRSLRHHGVERLLIPTRRRRSAR